MIDITKGYRQYSPTELREYAYKNLLAADNVELGDFLEYIFMDYKDSSDEIITQDDVDNARSEGYEEAINEMRGILDNM